MAKISEKIGQVALYFLLLAGPVLALATKGFAALLAISGSLAFIAFLIQPVKLKKNKNKQIYICTSLFIFYGAEPFLVTG